ncbi:mycothiol transferase [Nocardia sp. Marseille-Q1738]
MGRTPDCRSGNASLRWMLIHLVEETGRHAGHADIVRELLDWAKGYY